MRDDLEVRLRSAREGLGTSAAASERRARDAVVQRVALPTHGTARGTRRFGRVRALGGTAAVVVLALVVAVLFRQTRSAVGPATSPSVTVPRVVGLPLNDAYVRLRAAGLSVTINEWLNLSSHPDLSVGTQTPRRGEVVDRGTAVTLTTKPPLIVGSTVLSNSPETSVENFVGKTIGDAARWADANEVGWRARALPPLREATAPQLLDNWRVTRQTPTPGGRIWGARFTKRANGGGSIVAGPPLELDPVVTTSVPRIDLSQMLFEAHTFGPLFGRRRGSVVPADAMLGRVTVLQLTNEACTGCPNDPYTHLPIVSSMLDKAAGLVFAGPPFAPPPWWTRADATQFDVLVAQGGLGPLAAAMPGVAVVDRGARLALLLPYPVDRERLASAVAELNREPVPAIATTLTPLPLAAMDGAALADAEIPEVATLGLDLVGCSVDRTNVYRLGASSDGRLQVFALRASRDRVAFQPVVGGPQSKGSSGGGCQDAPSVRDLFRASPIRQVSVVPIRRPGRDPVIRYAAWVVADDTFTEAVVGGRLFPVRNNLVVIEGRFLEGTAVQFRGPKSTGQATLTLTPAVSGSQASP